MTSQTVKQEQPLDIIYKYSTISIDRLSQLQEDIDKLYREDKLSDNKTYRSYLEGMKFTVPENLPEAKSIIIIAVHTKPMLVNFTHKGKKSELIVPPQYYRSGMKEETLQETIQREIIKEAGYKIERSRGVHLKLLAVRSGLARYGRNNISYVEGMGSMITLYAYFTDLDLEDNWQEIRMMDECENCKICMKGCPGGCISEENFVIDVNKCVTLYNEVDGEFPDHIKPDAHNALFGCMKCQSPCPGNREAINQTGRFEDITEEETANILTQSVKIEE